MYESDPSDKRDNKVNITDYITSNKCLHTEDLENLSVEYMISVRSNIFQNLIILERYFRIRNLIYKHVYYRYVKCAQLLVSNFW